MVLMVYRVRSESPLLRHSMINWYCCSAEILEVRIRISPYNVVKCLHLFTLANEMIVKRLHFLDLNMNHLARIVYPSNYQALTFLFSCHNKKPPMIFYFIIEDPVTKIYLQKIFYKPCLTECKTQNEKTLHADLLLSGISQLVGVILADKIHKHEYIRSLKSLIA